MDDGYPYVVPLHYGYEQTDGKYVFYMHGAKEGHKIELIKKNPHAFIELDCDVELVEAGDIPCKYGSLYASVMGRGNASIVDEAAEKIHGLRVLMKTQTGRDFDITEAMASSVSVLKVVLDDISAKARKK